MNLLFIGSICPKNRELEVKEISSFFDYPGNTLQWALVNGFDRYANVKIVSVLRIISQVPYFQGSIFSHSNGSEDICMGTSTRLLKRKKCNGKRIAAEVIRSDYKPDMVFVYSLSLENLQAAHLLKRSFPQTKVVLMVTDLMEYMHMNSTPLSKAFKLIERVICYRYINQSVDSFVLLSEHMKDRIPVKTKPYLIVEGIIDIQNDIVKEEKSPNKVILYSGNLSSKYGIGDLLEAFSLIDDEDFRLWLCGYGDTVSKIKELSRQDNRIVYYGVIPRSQVLSLQREATLLVNPRHSSEEYTKYSFPSKTMEYMASGTPTLMCKLPCLPDDYKQYLFFFEDESILGMSKTLQIICNKPEEEMKSFGNRASQFIKKTKNPTAQTERIISFLEL